MVRWGDLRSPYSIFGSWLVSDLKAQAGNWAPHTPSPSSQGLALPGMLVLALRTINGLGLIGKGQCLGLASPWPMLMFSKCNKL